MLCLKVNVDDGYNDEDEDDDDDDESSPKKNSLLN